MEEIQYVETSLRKLKLRSGLALQTQKRAPGSPRDEAQFLAAVEGKGVMVCHEGRTRMELGSEYTVSGFSGLHDFYFSAPVIQTFEAPFIYAMLAYPGTVMARTVRRAARMKISLPAKVILPGESGDVLVMLVDVSVMGAMFQAPSPVGAMGDTIGLILAFPFENETVRLQISSTICHSNKNESGGVNVGVSFKDVSRNDKALLHCLTQFATD